MPGENNIHIEIVAPTGIIFQGEVDSISLPTFQGTITVLPHHAALFTKLSEGEVEIREGSKNINIVISGGFLEVKNNSAHVLADYAVRAESIEMAKAEEKKRLAEDKLKQKLSNEDFTVVDKDLRMSILELKVAQKVKKRQRTI